MSSGRIDLAEIAIHEPAVALAPLEHYLAQVAPHGRTMLLPALHHAQTLYGWLPREVQQAISNALRVPLADVHGVIEFYTMFYNAPTAHQVVRVCEDPACTRAGGTAVWQAIEQATGLEHGQTNPQRTLTYERVTCLGMCEHAPCVTAANNQRAISPPPKSSAFLAGQMAPPELRVYGEPKLMLGRINRADPTSLADYKAHGGYEMLPQAMALSPDTLIATVETYNIFGRGGAMFPLGRKWLFTRGAPGDPFHKHIVLNADESEPGTFKDRNIMEGDPFSLIEAMTIAAYAVGAHNGWIFLRGEYPLAAERLQNAIEQAEQAGLLGRHILGREGFHFDIELRLGAGAYICGEETALFEAIEGKRGFPRIKPPFPTTHGLFGEPTAVNNVETLVAMLAAMRLGQGEWQKIGTAGSSGTKLFCLSGDVVQPGVYEVPFGLTIRQLIEMGGGVKMARPSKPS
ncbi:MAG: NAD(P)H-dependent oxidoreductase subunit E [Chloroflexi bacterium]|nr:NAD(P)H-dependent oxidoreductase subunit E [Chloroflexota bacterium]